MIRYEDDDIILSGSTSVAFVRSILHQDTETMRRRDTYLRTLNQIAIEPLEDGFSAEIPDLVIPEETEVKEYSYMVSMPTFSSAKIPSYTKAMDNPVVLVSRYISVFKEAANISYTSSNGGLMPNKSLDVA